MTIYVYHNEKRGSRFEDNAHECRVAISEGQLHLVASVDTDSLEEAFELTNTINQPWVENDAVDALNCRDGARSTSVGDVFVAEQGGREVVFMVAGSGFKPLNIPADRLIASEIKYSQRAA